MVPLPSRGSYITQWSVSCRSNLQAAGRLRTLLRLVCSGLEEWESMCPGNGEEGSAQLVHIIGRKATGREVEREVGPRTWRASQAWLRSVTFIFQALKCHWKVLSRSKMWMFVFLNYHWVYRWRWIRLTGKSIVSRRGSKTEPFKMFSSKAWWWEGAWERQTLRQLLKF